MRRIRSDLWETRTESPFPGLTTHAYLLTRPDGNVLFYNTSHLDELEHMASLGGVAYHFLSHRDELGPSLNTIALRFGSRLGGHLAEKTDFAAFREPDILFEKTEEVLPGITVIPVPGHSPGSVVFEVRSIEGTRYLFTGDTLYRAAGGVWKAGFIPGHNSAEDRLLLADSLQRLRQLNPDLVIGSAFGADDGFEEVGIDEWHRLIDRALDELQAGAVEDETPTAPQETPNMPNLNHLSGRCLCGRVSVSLTLDTMAAGACHCSMCRKWGGGPLLAVECQTPVDFSGEEHIQVYASSDWAERGFCRHCGTHLFYRLKDGALHALPVGLLDDDPEWHLEHQVFIDEKPDFYSFAEETRNLTGAEVFSQFDAT